MLSVCDLNKVKRIRKSVIFYEVGNFKFTKNNTPPEVFLTFCNDSNSTKSQNTSHIQNQKQNINKVVFKNV